MIPSKSRLDREKKTVKTMVRMFCKKKHKPEKDFCKHCLELIEYAENRLKYCRFGENKPVCEKCPIHCYKTDMREKVRKVMRYAGPRMIYSHPIMGFRHLFNKRRKIQNINK